jgi:hypothetical protein
MPVHATNNPSAPHAGAASVSSASSSGRSPGLILLVAAFALLLISIQSISEVSEVLFQHVDDALLEDGTLFASLDIKGEDLQQMNDYGESEEEPAVAKPVPIQNQTFALVTEANGNQLLTLDMFVVELEDQYGLMKSQFSTEELEQVLNACARIWLSQASIQMNFTRVTVAPDAAQVDAYRWLVLGTKEQRKARFWKDVSTYLRKGASKLTAKHISEVIAKYLQFSGYPLMEWITSRAESVSSKALSIVPIAYWPWNNGGNLGRRIMLRAGSCLVLPIQPASKPAHRLKKPSFVQETICNGWSPTSVALPSPSVPEAARSLAHLIGNRLGLKRLSGARCSHSISAPPLMCVPPESLKGSDDFYSKATALDGQEIAQARAGALKLL